MKKLTFAFLCAACVALMGACGNSNENKDGEISEKDANEITKQLDLPKDGVNGYTGDAATDLKNVTDQNYIEIAKGIFGIDVTPKAGWKLAEVKSPNQVNNLNIAYEVEGLDFNAEATAFFDQCAKIATDGVYPAKMDLNTGAMSRGEKCATYADYLKVKDFGNMWFFDYGDKHIMFDISNWKNKLEIKLVLTSK